MTLRSDKTFIGRVEKDFDFLGYQFGEEKLTVSARALLNHLRRLTQLYEQKKHLPNWQILLDDYRRRWVTWVYAGIPSSILVAGLASPVLPCFNAAGRDTHQA